MSEESEKKYQNSSQYFENHACKYYPCHDMEHINCLFCYCPFYTREHCPGNPKFVDKDGIKLKVCTECTFPHDIDHYEKIVKLLSYKKEV